MTEPDTAAERDTRTKLLDTAELLFACYGVQGVSARTIPSESGASVAMVARSGVRDGDVVQVDGSAGVVTIVTRAPVAHTGESRATGVER